MVTGGAVNTEREMEMIIFGLMIFGLIIVVTIDAAQKRRKFLAEGK
jgi:hypothetical protein